MNKSRDHKWDLRDYKTYDLICQECKNLIILSLKTNDEKLDHGCEEDIKKHSELRRFNSPFYHMDYI